MWWLQYVELEVLLVACGLNGHIGVERMGFEVIMGVYEFGEKSRRRKNTKIMSE